MDQSPGLRTTLLLRDSPEEIHGFGECCQYGHVRQAIKKANPWNKQRIISKYKKISFNICRVHISTTFAVWTLEKVFWIYIKLSVLKQKAKHIPMVVFKVHWPCLVATKLSCLQKNNFMKKYWELAELEKRFFWGDHFDFFFVSSQRKKQPIYMRHRFFLHYGWFFHNLGKDGWRTFMHTTVYPRFCNLKLFAEKA